MKTKSVRDALSGSGARGNGKPEIFYIVYDIEYVVS